MLFNKCNLSLRFSQHIITENNCNITRKKKQQKKNKQTNKKKQQKTKKKNIIITGKTSGPLVLYRSLSAEDMLKSAIIEEKKFKHALGQGQKTQ